MRGAYKFLTVFLIMLFILGVAFAETPITTSNANGNWNDRNVVTFSCTDTSIYGCKDLNYSLNSGSWIDVNYPIIADCWSDSANPHLICSCNDLNRIDTNTTTLSWNYDLNNNIDFGRCDLSYTTGSGWRPIGTSAKRFTGTFDGNGFTIKNLYINLPGTSYVGLFGFVNATNPDINSINLVDVNITGNNDVGGISGGYGTIRNSSVSGKVTGQTAVGGIIGLNGIVYDSVNDSNVRGLGSVGGISGDGTRINKSYNRGVIFGSSSSIGGINGTNGIITNSYNTGYINACTFATQYSGGINGLNGTVSNSYNTGTVCGNIHVGGINGANGSVINSYNTGTILGTGNVAGIKGLSNNASSIVKNSFSTGSIIRRSGVGTTFYGDVGPFSGGGQILNVWWYDSNILDNATQCYNTGDANCTIVVDSNYTLLFNQSSSIYTTPPIWDGNWFWSGLNYPTLLDTPNIIIIPSSIPTIRVGVPDGNNKIDFKSTDFNNIVEGIQTVYHAVSSITITAYRVGTNINLSKVDVDCPGTLYDFNNNTSPFSIDMNLGTYTCDFLVNNGNNSYDRNTVTFSVTGSNSTIVYLQPMWWNTTWGYRKQITITSPADQNLYQWSMLTVNINSNYLNLNQKIQQDCNDFRVVDINNLTVMDININGCNTADTNIYFSFPYRLGPSSTNTQFYLYYGNSVASKYPNADKNWNTMYDSFDTNTLGTDWNYIGEWNITGGQAVGATNASTMIYNYRTYELPTDSVTFTTTLSDKGTFGNGNGKALFVGDTMNPVCGGDWSNAYWHRYAQSTDEAGGIYRTLVGTPSALVALESSTWTNIILKVNATTITADWTGGSGNPNTAADTTIRGIKHVAFGDVDCVAEQWGKIQANYEHNSTTALGAEQNPARAWWDNGWRYRQKLTLNTSKIGLFADVTNDHVILIDINSTNNGFWSNVIRTPNNYTKIDTFETGTAAVPPWVVSGMLVSSTYARNGGYGIGGTTTQYAYNVIPFSQPSGIYDFNAWVNATAGTGASYYVITQEAPSGSLGTTNEIQLFYLRTQHRLGYIIYNKGVSSGTVNVVTGITDGNWYKFNARFNYTTGQVKITFYGFSGNNLGSATANFNSILPIKGVKLLASDNTAGFDDVTYQQNILGDVRFINADNNVNYVWHSEDINLDTNRLLAWVGIPNTFPYTSNLDIFLYYGDPNARCDQNIPGTYPTTYAHVYHSSDPGSPINDSTYAANVGTITGATVGSTGKIFKAISFDGAANKITNVSNADNNPTSLTYYFWGKPAAAPASGDTYNFGGTVTAAQTDGWLTNYQNNGGVYNLWFRSWATDDNLTAPLSASVSTSTFSQFVFTLGASGKNIYFDKNLIGSNITTNYTSVAASLLMGADSRGGAFINDGFNGIMDEVKVFNVQLNQSEVILLYNSESDGNFVYYGQQDTNDNCVQPINTDWNISTQIDCYFKKIDLGTGKLIISPGGRLRLYDSNVIMNKLNLRARGNLIYVFSRSFLKIK